MKPDKQHMALVIMPLKSLMRDQVGRWKKYGVDIVALLSLSETSEEEISGKDLF